MEQMNLTWEAKNNIGRTGRIFNSHHIEQPVGGHAACAATVGEAELVEVNVLAIGAGEGVGFGVKDRIWVGMVGAGWIGLGGSTRLERWVTLLVEGVGSTRLSVECNRLHWLRC
jgi:hypothetical protein